MTTRTRVSENWPFNYISLAGDVFPQDFADRVNDHNKILWETLINKGYLNPEEDFNKQYRSERNRIESANEIVINNSSFKELYNRLHAENRMDYAQLRKISDTIYVFEIFSFDLKNLSGTEKFEMRFTVDLNMKTIRSEK